jgi:hypothetical protein
MLAVRYRQQLHGPCKDLASSGPGWAEGLAFNEILDGNEPEREVSQELPAGATLQDRA